MILNQVMWNQMMMNKKRGIESEPDLPTVQDYPQEIIQQIEDYCRKMGIVGFNYGRMNPYAALRMLKTHVGADHSKTAYEDRVEPGYEKLGTKTEAVKPSRQVLHG